MLVLGYHFERLVRERKVKNYAEIARLAGLTRARVTQALNLTLLNPRLQEQILLGSAALTSRTEHSLRSSIYVMPQEPRPLR
jgi:hypothetical protein